MIYHCSECGLSIDNKRSYDAHLTTHEKEKLRMAIDAQAIAMNISPNKNHQLKIHTCDHCGAGFVKAKGLKDRMEATKHKAK